MHLLIDIGNSTIVVSATVNGLSMIHTWRFKTLKDENSRYFRNEIMAGINKYHLNITDIASVTVASVVPEVNDDVSLAIRDICGLEPHFFCSEDASGIIEIAIESPSQLGNDRLADAIGAAAYYGTPTIIIDMGTATTIGVINEANQFLGGMIIPGVKTALNALCSRTSQLPTISINKPKNLIGRNTLECMQSGIVYGNAAMIDGIIDSIVPTLSGEPHIIATGGMASQIIPNCKHSITIDPYLQLKGLFRATQGKA